MRLVVVLVALTALISMGCMSVTVRPDGGEKVKTEANWQERQSFYLFGLVGESHVDVQGACPGQGVSQMQTQQTFVDGLFGLFSGGIYAPRTAKIWCE